MNLMPLLLLYVWARMPKLSFPAIPNWPTPSSPPPRAKASGDDEASDDADSGTPLAELADAEPIEATDAEPPSDAQEAEVIEPGAPAAAPAPGRAPPKRAAVRRPPARKPAVRRAPKKVVRKAPKKRRRVNGLLIP